MADLRYQMLENRRDAAVLRRAKLASDIAAVEAGAKKSKSIWNGETEADARENHLRVMRHLLVSADQEIAVMNQDLARWQLRS